MSGISDACEQLGGLSALARAIKVTPPTVHQWISGRRPIPVLRCMDVERATNGGVRCEDLRADVDWSVLRRPTPSRDEVSHA
ncbi:Cro/CI family transcriptional regulator [Castellaniella sp. UC4442_H9]